MVVYTDGVGNKYLGDCQWGTLNINYPTTSWLNTGVAHNRTSESRLALRQDILDMFSASGFVNTYILNETTFGSTNWGTQRILSFGFPGDTSTQSRFDIEGMNYNTATSSSGGSNLAYARAFNDNSTSPFPGLSWPSGILNSRAFFNATNTTDIYQYFIHSSSSSFVWGVVTYNSSYTTPGLNLFVFTKLLDVNTNFNYFNTPYINSCMLGHGTSMKHFIFGNGQAKTPLQTGRAAYTISCSDGQTPGSQWATDMWVYEDNATLGYPVIGRVPNMLLGIGSYTFLKPVKIQGSVFPDAGSPWYLPVGIFAGKTLLIRCYSSMT